MSPVCGIFYSLFALKYSVFGHSLLVCNSGTGWTLALQELTECDQAICCRASVCTRTDVVVAWWHLVKCIVSELWLFGDRMTDTVVLPVLPGPQIGLTTFFLVNLYKTSIRKKRRGPVAAKGQASKMWVGIFLCPQSSPNGLALTVNLDSSSILSQLQTSMLSIAF